MESQSAKQLVFEGMVDRPVVVKSSTAMMSSDAGLISIRQFDQRWKFTRRLAECLDDTRSDPAHAIDEMVSQRLFGIIPGYEDCNDHDDLRGDPVFKIVAGRRPGDDELASQPTLSRFENSITPAMLQRFQWLQRKRNEAAAVYPLRVSGRFLAACQNRCREGRVSGAGTNLRFVVTSLDVSTDDQARQVDGDYIQRGESEQRTLGVFILNEAIRDER